MMERDNKLAQKQPSIYKMMVNYSLILPSKMGQIYRNKLICPQQHHHHSIAHLLPLHFTTTLTHPRSCTPSHPISPPSHKPPPSLQFIVMPFTKKAHRIKKQLKQQKEEQASLEEQSPHSQSLEIVAEYVDEPFVEETPVKRALKMDPRAISNLPDEERERIRKQHPEMNEYFCMSQRDKTKYFHLMNQQYRQHMKLPEPPGSAPKKKTIRFKKRFEIKLFGYHDKCEVLPQRRSFMELYKAKNEAKHKRLSKFPKNL